MRCMVFIVPTQNCRSPFKWCLFRKGTVSLKDAISAALTDGGILGALGDELEQAGSACLALTPTARCKERASWITPRLSS